MIENVENLIVGQGLAGSSLAWTLYWAGQRLLLIDRSDEPTASRVSAGLMTPVTGKRLVYSPEFDEYLEAATQFYHRVEVETGERFFEPVQMIRLFRTEEEQARFLDHSDIEADHCMSSWQGQLQLEGRTMSGVLMQHAGRLDVRAYLNATRKFFKAADSFREADINFDGDLKITETEIRLSSLSLCARRLVLCTGAQATCVFPDVPNNPSRGDILTTRISAYDRDEVVHRGIWIAANSDGTQSVGATYDWKNLGNTPTAAGRHELLSRLKQMITGDVVVEQQVAAVRPTMKDYEPVIGCHSEYSNVFVFNGLGSKGSLRAPKLAGMLCRVMTEGDQPPERIDVRRLATAVTDRPRPLTTLAQDRVQQHLAAGDTAVDATVGNGFDTTFLSSIVGPAGQVIGFDVQECALAATSKRLQSQNAENVRLLHQGHEDMLAVVAPESASAIMFNLGFLPRSDHSIVTQPDTSTLAINSAVDCLKPGGILTVLSYRGHDGGQAEFDAVESTLTKLSQRYDVRRFDSTPPKPTAPVLFVLRKEQLGDVEQTRVR